MEFPGGPALLGFMSKERRLTLIAHLFSHVVHCSSIYKGSEMEATVVYSPLVGGENVLQIHNRAVLSHEKEAVLCAVDGTGDCYLKGK